MSNIQTRFATSEPTLCAVCHRHAFGVGYAPKQGQKLIWLCDDNGCHGAAREIFRMPQAQLDAHEIGAALAGGEAAGMYLDEIGKTDIATLDGDEWRHFLKLIVTTFEVTMRKRILNGEPPF